MPLQPQAVQIFLAENQREQAEKMQQQGGGFGGFGGGGFGGNGNGGQKQEGEGGRDQGGESAPERGELFGETRKSLEDFRRATDEKERLVRIVIE